MPIHQAVVTSQGMGRQIDNNNGGADGQIAAATTTRPEMPMDESSLVATLAEVQMQPILATPMEVYRQRGNRTNVVA